MERLISPYLRFLGPSYRKVVTEVVNKGPVTAHKFVIGILQEKLDAIASGIVQNRPEDVSDHLEWIAHSKTEYREACWGFCDLAARCQDLAIANDRAIVLGRDAARALGTVTVSRAIELMDGAAPETEFEKSLQVQLQDSNWEALKK